MYKMRILFQKHFTLTNQSNNKKTIKNKEKYSERTSKSWLGKTYDYNYVSSNNSKPSVMFSSRIYMRFILQLF